MSHGDTKSILVADDDLGFLLWASSTLAQAGYSPLPARTVDDALKLLDEADFHLLLINPSLPSASDLVRTARKKHLQLKVALLSESTDAGYIGVDAVIPKPANADGPDMASAWLKKIARLMSEHSAE
jgi:DNA-binding response OmpR family regulator